MSRRPRLYGFVGIATLVVLVGSMMAACSAQTDTESNPTTTLGASATQSITSTPTSASLAGLATEDRDSASERFTMVPGTDSDSEESGTVHTLPVENRGPVPSNIKEMADKGVPDMQIAAYVWETGGRVITDKDGNPVMIEMPDRIPPGIDYPSVPYPKQTPWDGDRSEIAPPKFLDPADLELFRDLVMQGAAFDLVQGPDGYLHPVVN
jgi:hypothetical protein